MNTDCWETPSWLYNQLDNEFHFKVDLCASESNCKAEYFMEDYLKNIMCKDGDYKPFEHWQTKYGRAFMNPPYSNPLPFVTKAWEDSARALIVCLLKCDPSTKTWAVFWDYENHRPKPGCTIRYLPKRLKFEYLGEPSKSSANFPSVLVIMERTPRKIIDEWNILERSY